MKKLALTSLLAITFTAVSFAQKAPMHKGSKMMQMHQNENFTPQQRASLKAKKLTIALELSDKQQKDLTALFTEEAQMMQKHHKTMKAQKEAGKEVNRYQLVDQHMDLKIDHQRKIKQILNEDQYNKWSKMRVKGKSKHVMGNSMKGHKCDGNCKMHQEDKGHQMNKMHQRQAPMRRK